MVTSLNATNFVSSNSLTSCNSRTESHGYVDVETSLNSQLDENSTQSFYDICAGQRIETVTEFNNYKKEYGLSKEFDTSSYDFYGYLNSRGCKNSDELKDLNSIFFKSRAELEQSIISTLFTKLQPLGCNLTETEIGDLVSHTDLKILAQFQNTINEAQEELTATKVELKKILAIKSLICKFSRLDGLSKNIQEELDKTSKSIDIYKKYLKIMIDKEDEEIRELAIKDATTTMDDKAQESESAVSKAKIDTFDLNENSLEYSEKYRNILISNYQN